MDTKRWESVKDLLHQALQLNATERSVFLDEACSSDISLRAEIESLLRADGNLRDSFMQSPPLPAELRDAISGMESGSGLEPGQIVAQRFQLVRKLGEGGMGQVWLAEQISPVRRQVALKLIRAGMYDEAVAQRFQSERQSLAMMDHPAIAKVFDAGTTEMGQPYFVMEYVPGIPITDYCDQAKLTIKDRLELFIQACEGVQHAHQKAIIHRDLKPANILVVEVDGKPVPRIIDFGLAKAATTATDEETMFTQLGSLVGTPAFMSPEQADPAVHDIDTRTDVYSLGVILYVLLTGCLPIDMTQWRKQPLEALQRLREEEPERPSTKVSEDGETSRTAANLRGTAPAHLISLLRGDLDWVTMKALEKDRARRYGTPVELAADIRHFLQHEPVVARPASTLYRAGKYIRRHRLTVAAVAVLVVLLAGFSLVQTRALRRITRERDRANNERDRATRISGFMTSMFRVSNPSEARGNTVTAREILDKASDGIRTGLSQDPEVESEMTQVMATTYQDLGLYPRAHDLAKSALDSRMKQFGPNDPRTLESMAELGWILDREGHFDEAEKLERQALDGERRVLAPDDQRLIDTIDHMGVNLEDLGRVEEAEKLAREAIQLETSKLGPENEQTLRSMNTLGGALWNEARYEEAEKEYRQLIEIARRVLGPDHPLTLSAMGNLSTTLTELNRYKEAEVLGREVLATQQRVLGPDHQKTLLTMDNLATTIKDEGHFAESEKLSEEVLAIRSRTLGPEHPDTLGTKVNVSIDLFEDGHVKEAEKMQREALAALTRVVGPENADTIGCQTALARTLTKEGRYAESEELARKTFETATRTLGPHHPETVDAMQQLGRAMAHNHRYDQASEMFRNAISQQGNSKEQGDSNSFWFAFACVATAANRPDDAIQDLREAIHNGYSDPNDLMREDDLKSLHGNPKFQEVVTELRQTPRAAAH